MRNMDLLLSDVGRAPARPPHLVFWLVFLFTPRPAPLQWLWPRFLAEVFLCFPTPCAAPLLWSLSLTNGCEGVTDTRIAVTLVDLVIK